MANLLGDSTSPYLLQHADNPVDWHPWDARALALAREQNKPVFLSIGYAACHWCHVMAHQCFEDADIAAVMNEHFINIKVDREERPDLDELYMLATQLMTGQGGWPMSVWLTPTLEPFYAGTYFPPTDGYGRPGFPRLLVALHDAWENRRAELIAQSRKVVEAIGLHADETADRTAQMAGLPVDKREPAAVNPQWIRLSIEQVADRFDDVHGGPGGAPKFPPHQMLGLWLAILGDADPGRTGVSGADQRIVAHKFMLTLDGMKNGGIYDHVGGAFARYSTDERWLVPHFEKMLYDSAQLAPVYAGAGVLLESAAYRRIARETLDFFLREMCSPEGAFYSSLDADSEGAEGKFYVWTPADIRAALPDEGDAQLIMDHFGITVEGNWHESPAVGGSVLAIARHPESLAQKHEVAPEAMRRRLDGLLEMMRAFRARRPGPGLDDKVLTSWNGLMLSALAVSGRVLGEPRYTAAAGRLAEFLLSRHVTEEGLMRVSRGGAVAHTPGFLDDHAFLLNGLVDVLESLLADADTLKGELRTVRDGAMRIAEALLADFQDAEHGGFYFTGPRHEKLFARMKNAADNATPSANGVAIRALLRLGRMVGNDAYRAAALRAVEAFRTHIDRRPEFFPTILRALLEEAAGKATAAGETPPPLDAGSSDGQHLSLTAEPIPPLTPGAAFTLRLQLTIADGFHIQPVRPAPGMTGTTIRLRSVDADILAGQEWEFPPPQDVHEVSGHAGVIRLQGKAVISEQAPAGRHVLRATLTAQVCTATACLPPEQASIDVPVTVQAS